MLTLNDAKVLPWGTYGISGKDPLKIVFLDECTTNHLENIYISLYERYVIDDDVVDKYMIAVRLIIESRKTCRLVLPENLFKME